VALIGVGPAAAAVTVGQVAPGTITSCSKNFDFLQASTPDNSYTLPAGVITSWTHRSQAGVGQQVTMKIFRKVGDPARYQAVGHDGPHPVSANTTTTFSTSVPAQAGDVLGITGAGGSVSIGCGFAGAGTEGLRNGNLLESDPPADFSLSPNTRVNLSAVVVPTNSFTLGAVERNKRKGTATVAVTVPNAGDLVLSGNGVKAAGGARASETVSAPGEVKLTIRAQGKRKKKLAATGKVKLSPTITYTPGGGDPSAQSVTVKLQKKNKK
jgi:hypothetical protein